MSSPRPRGPGPRARQRRAAVARCLLPPFGTHLPPGPLRPARPRRSSASASASPPSRSRLDEEGGAGLEREARRGAGRRQARLRGAEPEAVLAALRRLAPLVEGRESSASRSGTPARRPSRRPAGSCPAGHRRGDRRLLHRAQPDDGMAGSGLSDLDLEPDRARLRRRHHRRDDGGAGGRPAQRQGQAARSHLPDRADDPRPALQSQCDHAGRPPPIRHARPAPGAGRSRPPGSAPPPPAFSTKRSRPSPSSSRPGPKGLVDGKGRRTPAATSSPASPPCTGLQRLVAALAGNAARRRHPRSRRRPARRSASPMPGTKPPSSLCRTATGRRVEDLTGDGFVRRAGTPKRRSRLDGFAVAWLTAA